MGQYNTLIRFRVNDAGERVTDDNELTWVKYKNGSKKEIWKIMDLASTGDIPQFNNNGNTVIYYQRLIPQFGEQRTEFLFYTS